MTTAVRTVLSLGTNPFLIIAITVLIRLCTFAMCRTFYHNCGFWDSGGGGADCLQIFEQTSDWGNVPLVDKAKRPPFCHIPTKSSPSTLLTHNVLRVTWPRSLPSEWPLDAPCQSAIDFFIEWEVCCECAAIMTLLPQALTVVFLP